MSKKDALSKLWGLKYEELKMQAYLLNDQTSIAEKLTLFKWRTSMEQNFGENFRGGRSSVLCPFCLTHSDSQEEGFKSCTLIKDNIHINAQYENLFKEDVEIDLTRTIVKISSLRTR